MLSTELFTNALVVDDEPVAADLLVSFLKELGVCDVDVASSGNAALELCKKKSYALALIDMRLEGMDGVQLIREMTAILPSVRFIVASGLEPALLDLAARALDESGAHVCSVLRKPVTFSAIEEALSFAIVDRPATFKPYFSPQKTLSTEETLNHIAEGRLKAWFQPKVDITTGLISGCEALARICIPRADGGFDVFPPSAFIPSVEGEPHSAALLTSAMLRAASETMISCSDVGHPLVCAVNLSRALFNSRGLFDGVLGVAEKTRGVHPPFLFEVTETAVVADVGEMLSSLARLKMRGFRLSIDDFGTGYSSMQALVRIPFDELKIDRSFVSGAVKDVRTKAVLAATVSMAKSLGMATCAEGVETPVEYSLLASLGCSYIQGYLIAKPMPSEDFISLVSSGRKIVPSLS